MFYEFFNMSETENAETRTETIETAKTETPGLKPRSLGTTTSSLH